MPGSGPIFEHAPSPMSQGIVQWPPEQEGEKAIVYAQNSLIPALPISGLELKGGQLVAIERVGDPSSVAATYRITAVIKQQADFSVI